MITNSDIEQQINSWYQTPLGNILFEAEKYELEKFLPNIFGYHFLQIGGFSNSDWLASSPIKHKARYGQSSIETLGIDPICGDYNQLSILPDSCDAIFFPHSLELTNSPRELIQQAAIGLIPEGAMLILGFNPFSLWGAGRRIKARSKEFPWNINFHRIGSIRTMLSCCGCEVEELHTFFFRPPLKKLGDKPNKLNIFESLGQTCWPYLGGVYLLLARKRVAHLTQIPLGRAQRVFAKKSITQPTSRSSL